MQSCLSRWDFLCRVECMVGAIRGVSVKLFFINVWIYDIHDIPLLQQNDKEMKNDKNYRIEKQGHMSSMMLTNNPVNSRTIFSSFSDAQQALLAYADRVLISDKERRELKKCINGIREKYLEWDETHI